MAYARCFSTEAGQRVLADLQKKFGHRRSRFVAKPGQRLDYVQAAIIDGECNVIREIEEGIKVGNPVAKIFEPTPTP